MRSQLVLEGLSHNSLLALFNCKIEPDPQEGREQFGNEDPS